VYVNEQWGYCFAYPTTFTVDESNIEAGSLSLYGPALEDNADPIRVSLEITTQPVPEDSSLTPLVDAYLTSFGKVIMPLSIMREAWMLGSEPAEKLEPVPGLLSSRLIMALHGEVLFTLRFHPSDIDFAKPGLDELTQTVTGSFAFLPRADPAVLSPKTVSWSEFGQNISLSYGPILAPWVEAQTVPSVPVSDQILFSESHPPYAQFRFLGFLGGKPYDLPLLPVEDRVAQVMVFRTADFPGFGDDNPQGFVNQSQALKDMLQRDIEPARCAQPVTGEPVLPFLPWVNSKQSLCAQPKIIEFASGTGIRYLAYYAQGIEPVLEQQVFYTFQGLTKDEKFYISAVFPIRTGIFPSEPPPCPKCGEPDYDPFPELIAAMADQVNQLNVLPEDEFAPSLTVLDEVIKSVQVSQ
jgi:hypothetical protein